MERLETKQAIDTYPQRAQSLVKQAFNKSRLPFVGGINEGILPRETEYRHFLPDNPYHGITTPEGAEFASQYPHILEGLLVPPNNKAERYIAGVGAYDFHNLPEMAKSIALEDTVSPVVSRIVFGGTPEMQFRALSMLLPELQRMDKISSFSHKSIAAPKPQQLQVIFANHIASHINGFDYEKLRTNARDLVNVAELYIDTFFSGLPVVFLEDAPVETGSYIKGELDRLTEIANRVLPDNVKEKLAAKQNGLGNGTSFRYAAAHILMHDTNDPELVRPIESNKADAIIPGQIISSGGVQELDFYTSRFHLRPHAGDNYQLPTVQFFTKHGSSPYYPARGGDLSLHDAITYPIDVRNLQDVDRHVSLDINYFLAVTDSRDGKEKTDEFIRKLRERKTI